MKIMRAAGTLLASSGASFVLRLMRNVLIARLLTVENYGIASTFAVALSFVQMMTNFNFRRMLIQHRRGDEQDFSSTVVSLIMVQNMVMSAGLFFGAGPIAQLFGQPDLVWAYQIVAVSPLLNMLMHPDLERFQRTMRFGQYARVNVGTEAVTLLMAWPLTLWLGDFRVMLALLLAERLVRVLLSHSTAERRFALGWDWGIAGEGIRFGFPLMLGGLVVFATQQGDRIIVANRFSATDLGHFSAALTLVMPAVVLVNQLVMNFFMPLLARVQDQADLFVTRAAASLQATMCLGLGASLGFALLGPFVLELAFGARYVPATPLIGLIGIMFALQILRVGGTTVAMSRGDTVNLLVANVVRALFLPLALLAAVRTDSMPVVLAVGIAGQIVSYGAALVLLRVKSGVRGLGRLLALPLGLGTLSLAALLTEIWTAPDMIARLDLLTGLSALAFVAMIGACRALQGEMWRLRRSGRG